MSPSEIEAFETAVQASASDLDFTTFLCGEGRSNPTDNPFFSDTCNAHNTKHGKNKKIKTKAQSKTPQGTKSPKIISKKKAQTKSPRNKGLQNSLKNDKGHANTSQSKVPKDGI